MLLTILIDESFNTDYDKAPYAKNCGYERWRKQIKLSALSSLTERLKVQKKINGVKLMRIKIGDSKDG
jgi:carboxyl-terminal processing protease